MSIIVEPYTVDHFRALTGQTDNLGTACLNQISGPAFTLLDGGQVLAVGGIRVQGIGQAWALLSEEIKGRRLTLLKTARQVLEQSIAHERLFRVYAEATVNAPAFFEHLGFHQQNNLYVR